MHLNRMRKLTIHEELEQFVHACQLDVFISLCRVDCIWTDTADTTFYVEEVCNKIYQLRQVCKDGKYRTFTDTLEDLYQKYLDHDIEAVYKNASTPESKLRKKHHSISYHMTRKAVASGACHIAKEDTLTNLADLFTKVLPKPRREYILNKFTY